MRSLGTGGGKCSLIRDGEGKGKRFWWSQTSPACCTLVGKPRKALVFLLFALSQLSPGISNTQKTSIIQLRILQDEDDASQCFVGASRLEKPSEGLHRSIQAGEDL